MIKFYVFLYMRHVSLCGLCHAVWSLWCVHRTVWEGVCFKYNKDGLRKFPQPLPSMPALMCHDGCRASVVCLAIRPLPVPKVRLGGDLGVPSFVVPE